MNSMLLAMPENGRMARNLARQLDWELGEVKIRRFPDGESHVRIDSDVSGRRLAIVCSLDQPDEKFLPLSLLGATARDLGAAGVGLIAPYLAYMRQDTRFQPGEGVTSVYFAKLLGANFDWLATVDPHLHRRKSLSEIYAIPCAVARAGGPIAEWIRANVTKPVIVGPDSESEQWVANVAALAEAPHVVLEKTRFGDRDVAISAPGIENWKGRTPVLVDDIVSTARTMVAAATHFRQAGLAPVVAIGIHGLFVGNAFADLEGAGADRVVTCNTVPHPSNAIDIAGALAQAVRDATDRLSRLDLDSRREGGSGWHAKT